MTQASIDVHSQDGVAVVTINRPAKRNALSAAMCEDLRRAWEGFRDSDDRVAILRAEGDIFTAGADLSHPPSQFWKALPDLGISIGKPVIAAVHGPVIGMGVAIVAFCDLCVATSGSKFIYPEARVGVAAGLISALVARIPHKIALAAGAHALADGIASWREQPQSLGALIEEAATPGGTAAATIAAMDAHGYGRAILRGLRAGVARAGTRKKVRT